MILWDNTLPGERKTYRSRYRMLRPECALPVRCRPGQDAGGHGRGPRLRVCGIQALRRLAADLDPARLSGNVILLPLANPSAFYAGAKQVVPEDGVNLNRLPGNSAGPLSARLAFALEAALYPKPICWQISTAETAAKRFIHWCSSRQEENGQQVSLDAARS